MTLGIKIIRYVNQLRENIGIEIGQLIGPIREIIDETGYKYKEDHFGNDFSAYCQFINNIDYLIAYNLDQDWNENFKRFTISHELGHLSMPEHRSILSKEKIHYSRSEYQSNSEIEREADYFAINFLAPQKLFESQMKLKPFTKNTIFFLSDFFSISTYAAALRFMDLTDLTCSLIVCNKNGFIEYEKRSKRMKQSFRHDFLYRQKILGTTLTSDWINGNKEEDACEICLSDWYRDLEAEIKATESVIELGYNNKYLTLIEPEVMDIDVHLLEHD